MLKLIIIILLILHLVGDIYLKQKEVINYKHVLSRSFIYLLLFFVPFLLFGFHQEHLILAVLCSFTNLLFNTLHYLLDTKTIFWRLRKTPFFKNHFFITRQLMQIGLIVYFTYQYQSTLSDQTLAVFLTNHFIYLKWVLALLLIGKPSNLVFKHVFMQFKPIEKPNESKLIPFLDLNKTFKNAGAAIGTLERILILICLVNDLYSSIGLILTAKSIARYNRITEDPEFSEYYLLGTLSSVLFTIVIYCLSFYLF